MIRTGMMKAKMNTQIFKRFSQYQAGWENLSVQSIEPCLYLVVAMNITGRPIAEERIQLQTLTILAFLGVRKSRALTGWQTAT